MKPLEIITVDSTDKKIIKVTQEDFIFNNKTTNENKTSIK